MTFKEDYEKTCKDVFTELEKTMASIDTEALEQLTEDILNADQVFFVGVGRVMLALQCVCKRLAHLGIKAHYVGEITEPAITKKDLLIVGSGSGGSLFPLGIAKKARKTVDCKIVHIGSNPNSEMKEIADYIKTNNVKYIFFEELVSPKIAQSLADETGVQLLALNPFEGLDQEDIDNGADYISVMEENLKNLVTALK